MSVVILWIPETSVLRNEEYFTNGNPNSINFLFKELSLDFFIFEGFFYCFVSVTETFK